MSDYFCGVIDKNKTKEYHKRKHGLCSFKAGIRKYARMNNSDEVTNLQTYFLHFLKSDLHTNACVNLCLRCE